MEEKLRGTAPPEVCNVLNDMSLANLIDGMYSRIQTMTKDLNTLQKQYEKEIENSTRLHIMYEEMKRELEIRTLERDGFIKMKDDFGKQIRNLEKQIKKYEASK